jgi:hypothetical protein
VSLRSGRENESQVRFSICLLFLDYCHRMHVQFKVKTKLPGEKELIQESLYSHSESTEHDYRILIVPLDITLPLVGSSRH